MTSEDREWLRAYMESSAHLEAQAASSPTERHMIEVDRERATRLLDEVILAGPEMPRGAVFVVVPCRPDQSRWIDFHVRIQKLDLPPGSQIRYYPGFFAHVNRTVGMRHAVKAGADYVFFVDDDQLLLPDTVMRLLRHDKDIVSVNLTYKEKPFQAYMFDWLPKGTRSFDAAAGSPEAGQLGGMWCRPLGEQRGLVEVDACGLGGVLIKTSVFAADTEHEWFAVNQNVGTDDFYFCELAQKHGFRIWVDMDVPSGHLNYCSVWPVWNGTRWEILVVLNNGGEFVHPAAVSSPQRDRLLAADAERGREAARAEAEAQGQETLAFT